MTHLLVVMERHGDRHAGGNTRAPYYGEGVVGLLHGHKVAGCSGRRGHVDILTTIGLNYVRLSMVGLTGGGRWQCKTSQRHLAVLDDSMRSSQTWLSLRGEVRALLAKFYSTEPS